MSEVLVEVERRQLLLVHIPWSLYPLSLCMGVCVVWIWMCICVSLDLLTSQESLQQNSLASSSEENYHKCDFKIKSQKSHQKLGRKPNLSYFARSDVKLYSYSPKQFLSKLNMSWAWWHQHLFNPSTQGDCKFKTSQAYTASSKPS